MLMNISKIVFANKCMSCGMCASICPTDAINMKFDLKEGIFKPDVNYKKCIDCSKCSKTCPAGLDFCNSTNLIGEYKKLILAHSADNKMRYQATSGGIISSLVCYMLEYNIVDAVMLVHKDDESIVGTSVKILTRADLKEYKNSVRDYASRYVIIPVLENIENLYKKYKKMCVVGTPCQIRALKLRYDDKIIRLGITCSGGMSFNATKQYKKLCGCPEASMYYRGNGWPGKNSLVTKKCVVEESHLGSFFERMFSSQVFKNSGCRYCTDHFSEMSDISFCDFWNHIELKSETYGNTCVIIRTNRGKEIFDNAKKEKFIEVVKELSYEDVVESQKKVLQVKKGKAHNSIRIKIFWFIIDIIRKKDLYKHFSKVQYETIAKMYSKTIGNEKFKK